MDLYRSLLRKFVSRSEAVPIVDETRKRGGVIVFTNGCFDLLHSGHVVYLQNAKALGDLLVVAINSDESVREIKGPRRPINPLEERALVLSGLSSVDLIIPFEEPTPYPLIAMVQPDVLVKGGDWAESDIVGRDLVEARGGKVVRLSLREGISTTEIIRRILKAYARPEG